MFGTKILLHSVKIDLYGESKKRIALISDQVAKTTNNMRDGTAIRVHHSIKNEKDRKKKKKKKKWCQSIAGLLNSTFQTQIPWYNPRKVSG